MEPIRGFKKQAITSLLSSILPHIFCCVSIEKMILKKVFMCRAAVLTFSGKSDIIRSIVCARFVAL